MGLFSRFERVTYPPDNTPPGTPREVREALLALNGPDAPWIVRDGSPDGADLVADWRLTDPAWRGYFARVRDDSVLQTRMRLMPDERQVRSLDYQRQLGNTRGQIRTWGRGQFRWTTFDLSMERGPDGKRRVRKTTLTDTAELKNPLRDAVLAMGWSWRARLSTL
ncbi:hypothetical protein ABZ626_13835 [Streptomyces longispororuber]|uniref:hypothetical protein n=1 Tax=Streptomyces longispororuber TaxID=68230 RepID=UPI0033CC136A